MIGTFDLEQFSQTQITSGPNIYIIPKGRGQNIFVDFFFVFL